MFCPRCGQQQSNYETRFCSQCGFLMNGMLDIVAKGGLPREIMAGVDPNSESPRKRGLRQGGLLMLSSFILVPLSAILTVMLGIEPFGVVITVLLTFWGGFLRILYAAIFQSGIPTTENLGFFQSLRQEFTGKKQELTDNPGAFLPEANGDFMRARVGNWRETNDLQPAENKPFRS
ncbi:MAG: zinc ribbon domain-containing protein [Acidobacteria bacterium]|nr:zinc ribbon domain-containing protein [Acidobacteriota bacterium]